MSDYLDLALTYGGYTGLDRVYLTQKLANLTDQQKLDFITPPPSVVNAYFSEIYHKQSPQAALAYLYDLSCALNLFVSHPSFAEEKPFVRLNVGGKSYGLAYTVKAGPACIFAEEKVEFSPSLLFELARLFPSYLIHEVQGKILLEEQDRVALSFVEQESPYLLTRLARGDRAIKLWGPSQEEVLEAALAYPGHRYYAWEGRTALVYLLS